MQSQVEMRGSLDGALSWGQALWLRALPACSHLETEKEEDVTGRRNFQGDNHARSPDHLCHA